MDFILQRKTRKQKLVMQKLFSTTDTDYFLCWVVTTADWNCWMQLHIT